MIQTLNYTAEELRSMISVDKKKGEKSAPVIIFDGKPVHEILDAGLLTGEVFRSVKWRYDSKISFDVSNLGRVKYNGKILPQREESANSNGYLVVEVPSPYPVHVYKIVADAWLEPPADKSKFEIHHISNNGYDNRPQNLIWVEKDIHKQIHDIAN